MGDENKSSVINNEIDYLRELKKLIDFLMENRESGRFVEDLLKQLSIFKERVRITRKELNKKEPLLDALLELILHDLILRDSRVSELFEISIEDARRAMETLCNQMREFFMLRKDDRFGWDMIIKKEATIIGIK